jgi:hypothetical protein
MAKITTNRGGKKKPVANVDQHKQATVFSTLEDIISGQQSPVDIKNFAYLFMEKIGGPQGFVDKVMEEYEGAPMGSLARSRVLDIMMKLFQLATPKESHGDYSELTDDDLKDVIKKHLAPNTPHAQQWVDHVCI